MSTGTKGYYYKIGRLVYFEIRLVIANSNNSSVNLDLPVPCEYYSEIPLSTHTSSGEWKLAKINGENRINVNVRTGGSTQWLSGCYIAKS